MFWNICCFVFEGQCFFLKSVFFVNHLFHFLLTGRKSLFLVQKFKWLRHRYIVFSFSRLWDQILFLHKFLLQLSLELILLCLIIIFFLLRII